MLHGYPSYFKFTKNSAGVKKANANVIFDSSEQLGDSSIEDEESFEVPDLSKAQHSQRLMLLKKSQLTSDAPHSLMAFAHFAGPSLKKPLAIGRLNNGQYKMQLSGSASPSLNCFSNNVNSNISSHISVNPISYTTVDSIPVSFPIASSCKSIFASINKMDII